MESYSSLSNAMHTFLLAQKIIPNATKLINNELVQVFLIDTSLQASCILEHLKESSGGALYPQLSVIGFDTETCINRKQTLIDFTVGGHLRTGKLSSIPSTIQIAISHHIVFVFRCFVMCFDESTKTLNHNLFPKALCNFLKCKSITKLGVATSKDAIDLDYYFDCKVKITIESPHLFT